MRQFFTLLSLALCLTCLWVTGLFSSSPPRDKKIAVADFEKVYRHSKEVKKVKDWLKKKHQSLAKKIEKYKLELNTLREKLKILHPESKRHREIKWKVETKILELERFTKFRASRLKKEYETRLAQTLKKVQKKIRKHLRKEGYTLVLNLSGDPDQEFEHPVFYHHPRVNLTDQLIGTFQ